MDEPALPPAFRVNAAICSPDTRAALALAEFGRDGGLLHEARRALMDAFWR
ncbi:MAG TPA: hypothetical protein VMT17_02175 [Anaeromyxobacteraceae bacterium]|nr:hypothetical protein [Anaeromyxobacteraceae bacterium]